jgi:DNA-directed RNA polymerase beta subunit
VHPTYNGYVCPVHSPDGQEVGLIKQLAITAIISDEGNSLDLIRQILTYESIHPIETANIEEMQMVSVSTIFVNGVLIGYSNKSVPMIRKELVQERRVGKIDKYVSIHADVPTGELNISCNGGRCLRPLIIIYENEQGEKYVKLTKKHIDDNVDFDVLAQEGVIEWIESNE